MSHVDEVARANEERRAGHINIFIPQTLASLKIRPQTVVRVLMTITNGRTYRLEEMTWQEVAAALENFDKRARSQHSKVKREALKADGKCLRCGGAGQADKWTRTGLTCYSCNGSGTATPEVKF
jgi:hypothetical protein